MSDIIERGDPWNDDEDGHYRGTRYTCTADGAVYWKLPGGTASVRAASGHERIVEAFLQTRPEGGSFRITESQAVITKVETPVGESETEWHPVYVCEFEQPILFEEVDVLATKVEPLDLWPSFYDGARYSIKRGKLYWKDPDLGEWRRTVESLPRELRERIDRVKKDGGSFRITENGKVIALIAPQPLKGSYKAQWESFSNVQKRLIAVKKETTDLLPVFIGEFFGSFTLRPHRGLTEDMTDAEEAELVAFLSQYGTAVDDDEPEVFDDLDEIEDFIDSRDEAES